MVSDNQTNSQGTTRFITGISCTNKHKHSDRPVERHSHFWIGLHGQLWVDSMADFFDLMMRLVSLKPHKRLDFQQGFHALSTI
jgi:hypothetical protein